MIHGIFQTVRPPSLLTRSPMDTFDEDSRAFMAWLRKSGAEISSKIELKDLRSVHAGRGVGKLPLYPYCLFWRLRRCMALAG